MVAGLVHNMQLGIENDWHTFQVEVEEIPPESRRWTSRFASNSNLE